MFGDYFVDERQAEAIQHPELQQFVVQPGPRLYLKAEKDHQNFMMKLCNSFQLQYDMGLISWPRSFSTEQKRQIPCHRIANIEQRAERDIYDTLVVKESSIKGLNATTGEYTVPVGQGLFAGINYKKGQKIVKFKDGERISLIELQRRELLGKGGYALHINSMEAMDCYSVKDSCKASKANDPTGI